MFVCLDYKYIPLCRADKYININVVNIFHGDNLLTSPFVPDNSPLISLTIIFIHALIKLMFCNFCNPYNFERG